MITLLGYIVSNRTTKPDANLIQNFQTSNRPEICVVHVSNKIAR